MLTFRAYFSSNIIDFTDREMCYLKDLSDYCSCETLLESKLILFPYHKYLEANAVGFQAIYSELKSSFERKTR